MAAPALQSQKIKRITANLYRADLTTFGVDSLEQMVGMAVSIAADPQDLTTVKVAPYLGSGPCAGFIVTGVEIPSGYESTNGTWKTTTISIDLEIPGRRVLAKAALTAGAFVKYDTTAPVGVVAGTNATDSVGWALAPASANGSVPVAFFKIMN